LRESWTQLGQIERWCLKTEEMRRVV